MQVRSKSYRGFRTMAQRLQLLGAARVRRNQLQCCLPSFLRRLCSVRLSSENNVVRHNAIDTRCENLSRTGVASITEQGSSAR